jgi:signal recognition particle GTPase
MNFALGLAGGKIRGVSVDSVRLVSGAQDPQQALATLETLLLVGDVSKQTHETISKQLDDPKITQRKLDDASHPPNVAAIAGLILGSPEFQRR